MMRKFYSMYFTALDVLIKILEYLSTANPTSGHSLYVAHSSLNVISYIMVGHKLQAAQYDSLKLNSSHVRNK